MDGHLGDVVTLTTTSTGNIIFSGARDNTIRAWDVKTHTCIREIKDQDNLSFDFNCLIMSRSMHKGDVTNLFCVNDNKFLLSFSMDGTMHLYELGSMLLDAKNDGDLSMVDEVVL